MLKIDFDQAGQLMKWAHFGAGSDVTTPLINPYFEIGSVILVGALMSVSNEDKLSHTDFIKVSACLEEMLTLGFKFSDRPTFSVCNGIYGDDFIRDTPTADLIMLTWVNKGFSNVADMSVGMESPLLKQGQTWEKAFQKADAPFLAMITDNWSCVGINDVPSTYSHLNPRQDPLENRDAIFAKNGPV